MVRAETERLCQALARTQPTRPSCEVRLALTDWLHRQLRRSALRLTEAHKRTFCLATRSRCCAAIAGSWLCYGPR